MRGLLNTYDPWYVPPAWLLVLDREDGGEEGGGVRRVGQGLPACLVYYTRHVGKQRAHP